MQLPLDSTKHQGQRQQMVALLKEKGIVDPAVIGAMEAVPRHWFMDPGLVSHAYKNKAYPIAAEQTISHPYTVAFQSQLINVGPGAKVLEIGTGSGYQTAVLKAMGLTIYTIERQRELFKKTQRLFEQIGLRPKKYILGDGYLGLPDDGSFDAILVTAGAPSLPKDLLRQLKIGGRLVIPIGTDPQIMHRFTRTGEKSFDKEQFGEFRFVPMLKDKN
ncbi:protein-L-isoaspartate(D-aspartate) O-methyltransferase [Flavobacteriaceae bacterium]|nr:protein-L-isoaspartate(D-aspartate) O-methyltransferase [Flavobacteriaceae bacterium]